MYDAPFEAYRQPALFRVLHRARVARRYSYTRGSFLLETERGEQRELVETPNGWRERVDNAEIRAVGARFMSMHQFTRHVVGRVRRAGVNWYVMPGEVAAQSRALATLCQGICNTQTGSGDYLIHPDAWAAHRDKPLDLPYLPEFDSTRPTTRRAAALEGEYRILSLHLKTIDRDRRAAIREALRVGHSCRELAATLNLSPSRVHQLARPRRIARRRRL